MFLDSRGAAVLFLCLVVWMEASTLARDTLSLQMSLLRSAVRTGDVRERLVARSALYVPAAIFELLEREGRS